VRSLVTFIIHRLYGILFIFLEVVAFYWLFQSNKYSSFIIYDVANELAGKWYDQKSKLYQYFSLKEENEKLSQLNSALLNKSYFAYNIISNKEITSKDTSLHQEYTFIPAIVINSTFSNQKNYITLNIGKNKGIQRDMAVITDNGIIGSVKDVSEHYSTVITLLHKDFLVNCMLKDGSCGPLSWDGKSKNYLQMNDVPLHAKIKKGDTVYTSHFSHIFPMYLPVGVVESFERKQKNPFYTVNVKIFTDFSSVKHVYVVKHLYKDELDSLQNISFK